uniref:Uncharacterized protein n=1 Tax=Kwoniella dejecticola CBS 10117 TaxID=1296121 RepID=A0A1A6A4W7_9TREE|nr:uncharacterized protein I303_04433 [Kwoniella dejecticola CBS 10117]OBR85102.1 hypothetical protein I303_04433 [Kwoniella dejecticola CBS 10117]
MTTSTPQLGDEIPVWKLMGVEELQPEVRKGPTSPGPHEAIVAPQWNGLWYVPPLAFSKTRDVTPTS